VEFREEFQQFFLVLLQNLHNWFGFVRIGYKHLEHMERFELNVSRFIAQQIHHQLQIIRL
jgi:hypothetical protein